MDYNLRNEILNSSKRLFYQNGYDKTSIRQIALDLHIHHPNIYYYFKSKKDIASSLYGDFYQNLNKKITECIPQRDIYYTATYLRLHYKVFYWNKKLFTLYYDFTKEGIVENYVRPFAIKNYHLYLDAFNLSFTDKELHTFFSIASSIEYRFIDSIIHKNATVSFEETVDFILKAPLLFMGISNDAIQDILTQSFINANKVDFKTIEQIATSFIKDTGETHSSIIL